MEAGINDIIENRDSFILTDIVNGKVLSNTLPTNADTAIVDLFQTVEQTQKKLGPMIDEALSGSPEMLRKRIPPDVAISAIEKAASNSALVGTGNKKALQDFAKRVISEYEEAGDMTLQEAHAILKRANSRGLLDNTFEIAQLNIRRAGEDAIKKEFYEILDNSGSDVLKRYGNMLELRRSVENRLQTKMAKTGVEYSKVYAAIEGLKMAVTGQVNPSALGIFHGVNDIVKANKTTGKQRKSRETTGSPNQPIRTEKRLRKGST